MLEPNLDIWGGEGGGSYLVAVPAHSTGEASHPNPSNGIIRGISVDDHRNRILSVTGRVIHHLFDDC